MFLPAKMTAVRIYVHEDELDNLLYEIGRLKCLHLIDARETIEGVQYVETGETLFRIASLVSRLSSLLSTLGVEARKEVSHPLIKNLGRFLDEVEDEVGRVEDEVLRIQSEIAELKRRGVGEEDIKKLESRVAEIAEEKSEKLSSYLNVLKTLMAMEEAKGLMAKTRSIYVFEGWVPEKSLEKVTACVEKCGGYITTVSKEGPSPTVVEHSKHLKVFEILVKTYGLPSNKEIDPTVFFALSFPIIFGMMFGDIGHGLLMLTFGLLLHWVRRRIKREPTGFLSYIFNAAPLMVICAPSSVFFGFLYGEFFGNHEWFIALTGFHKPLWFSPLKSPMTLFKYAILVGVVQISFGLILDFINKTMNRRFKEALTGPLMWMWLYWSGVYLVLTYGRDVFKVLFDPMVIGPFILLPFTAMAIVRTALHGARGVMESLEQLISSFSHTVSYLRILALNMIHGIFSKMFLPADPLGFIAFIFGTVFVILGFEQLLVFLHTLRLHWVEWFTKFYQGTGMKYQPFVIET